MRPDRQAAPRPVRQARCPAAAPDGYDNAEQRSSSRPWAARVREADEDWIEPVDAMLDDPPLEAFVQLDQGDVTVVVTVTVSRVAATGTIVRVCGRRAFGRLIGRDRLPERDTEREDRTPASPRRAALSARDDAGAAAGDAAWRRSRLVVARSPRVEVKGRVGGGGGRPHPTRPVASLGDRRQCPPLRVFVRSSQLREREGTAHAPAQLRGHCLHLLAHEWVDAGRRAEQGLVRLRPLLARELARCRASCRQILETSSSRLRETAVPALRRFSRRARIRASRARTPHGRGGTSAGAGSTSLRCRAPARRLRRGRRCPAASSARSSRCSSVARSTLARSAASAAASVLQRSTPPAASNRETAATACGHVR